MMAQAPQHMTGKNKKLVGLAGTSSTATNCSVDPNSKMFQNDKVDVFYDMLHKEKM